MNRILEIPTEDIQNAYFEHKLEILGKISDDLLEQIYQKIKVSKQIPQKYIKKNIIRKKVSLVSFLVV